MLALLPNDVICEHVKVFYHISAGKDIHIRSLFSVWNNETRTEENVKQAIAFGLFF